MSSQLTELNDQLLTQVVVAVTNNHPDRDFTGKYAGVTYRIPPSATRSIPYHAAVLWFGDPRATNVEDGGPYKQLRAKEVERLGVWYGSYGDPLYSEHPRTVTVGPGDNNPAVDYYPNPCRAMGGTDDIRFTYVHPHLPAVTVTELGEDAPLNVVINNPDDDRFTTDSGESPSDTLAKMAGIQAMVRAEFERVAAQLDGSDPDRAAEIREAYAREALPTIPVTPTLPSEPVAVDGEDGRAFNIATADTDDADDPTLIAEEDLPGPTIDGAPRAPRTPTTPKRKA